VTGNMALNHSFSFSLTPVVSFLHPCSFRSSPNPVLLSEHWNYYWQIEPGRINCNSRSITAALACFCWIAGWAQKEWLFWELPRSKIVD